MFRNPTPVPISGINGQDLPTATIIEVVRLFGHGWPNSQTELLRITGDRVGVPARIHAFATRSRKSIEYGMGLPATEVPCRRTTYKKKTL